MKVLDLQCAHEHRFEGWFASEDDFRDQLERGLVQCPACGDAAIVKRLSAPRLNFGSAREPEAQPASPSAAPAGGVAELPLRQAWLTMARHIAAHSDDVGRRFAEEARRMHYGEAEERAIRGQATPAQTEALLEEGIAVMPLPLPPGFKGTLQ